MAQIGAAEFKGMNIMAGTARGLNREGLSSEDLKVWDRDFDLLVDDLSKVIDQELGANLAAEKAFYQSAAEVAKGYFDSKEFGGLKAGTGQFGFRLAGPQDLKQAATDATNPAGYSWVRKVTTTSIKTEVTHVLGYGAAAAYACNESSHKEVLAFHKLISFKPSPRIQYIEFTVNDYPYTPYNVELFSKIAKDGKLYKLIPMPARVILHPGGKIAVDMYFDLEQGQTAPVGTSDIDIEIGVFGLVFGEYDYLDAAEIT